MTWKSGPNAALGISNPGNVDAVATVPIGTVSTFVDDVQGPGTFIYLPGAANVAAGDLVAYDLLPGGAAVTRATGLANSGRPVAVASAAITAGQFGWFQIGGIAAANVIAGTAVGQAYLSATVGQIGSTAIPGAQVVGARCSAAVGTPAAGKGYVTLNNPNMQSAIT